MDLKSKLNLQNINYALNRLLKGKGKLNDIAVDCIEISPAIRSSISPSFYFDNELENILQFHPETTKKNEMIRIKGGSIVHEATLCWQIQNAYIANGAIYKNNFKKVYPSKTINAESKKLDELVVDEIALASSYQGIKYFGHWLRDDVVTYMAAKCYGVSISFSTDLWPDKSTYSEAFEQDWNQYFTGRVKSLSLFQDFAQNRYRIERYQQLRTMIKQKYSAHNTGGYVYLKRGLTGKNIRNLVNEDLLIDTLEKQNFKILDITKHSLEYILENLIDAKLVITLEGSHQNHILYTLAEKGSLIILQPPNLFNNSAKDWCYALGFKHGITVCTATENGFEVNVNSILKLIDMMKP